MMPATGECLLELSRQLYERMDRIAHQREKAWRRYKNGMSDMNTDTRGDPSPAEAAKQEELHRVRIKAAKRAEEELLAKRAGKSAATQVGDEWVSSREEAEKASNPSSKAEREALYGVATPRDRDLRTPTSHLDTERPPISVLPELDLLRSQLLHQRLLIEALQSQLAQQVVQKHEEKRLELMKELQDLKKAMADKYNIDLDTHVIMVETGEVVPKSAIPDVAQMLNRVAGNTTMGLRKE